MRVAAAGGAARAVVASTIFKKVVMAITGGVMVGWLGIHMLGNLQILRGPEVLDAYGASLQSAPWIWPARAIMSCAVGVHVWSAVALVRSSNAARPQRYQHRRRDQFTTMAAHSMRWGGLGLLLFLLFHLADLTFGVPVAATATFEHGAVYDNVTSSLARPPVAALYIAANMALALHLYHGVWSMVHTLGLAHPAVAAWRRPIAALVAIVIPGGNVLITLGCLTGLVHAVTGA